MAYDLESLIQIINNILSPDQDRWILDDRNKLQLETLVDKARSLDQILERSSSRKTCPESLVSKIRDAANTAEDIIESHMVDQMLSNPEAESLMFASLDLQNVIQDFDSALSQMENIKDGSQMPSRSLSGVSFRPDPVSSKNKDVPVGLGEDLIMLKDRLTGPQPTLEILPVVGMGGIGKTTLARHLYSDPLIVSSFDTLAWVTISQEFDLLLDNRLDRDPKRRDPQYFRLKKVLLDLLGCVLRNLSDDTRNLENNQLAVLLHKSLSNKRYLIVVDDVWSPKAWDYIQLYLPNDNNGSRIILTTRESDVAAYVNSSIPQYQVNLLNEVESWKLLREKVFGEEGCDPQLEKIGRKVASNCGGLPLAIVVIAGVLKENKNSKDVWEQVARDVSSAITKKDEQFSGILSLSYDHLPYHLKPCFLYIGAFPEDYEVQASKLIMLLVADGFLKSTGVGGRGDESLEEAAEEYLKALVDRNLLLVRQRKSNGKVKIYGIHDLLRDMCLNKAAQEEFIWESDRKFGIIKRRVRVHPLFLERHSFIMSDQLSLVRSFLYLGASLFGLNWNLVPSLRLLRLLDVFDTKFHQFPMEILQLVNLRFLALSFSSSLPPEISRLWNLQTLIVQSDDSFQVPFEILKLPELRHFKFKSQMIFFRRPDRPFHHRIHFVHEKLQTVSMIVLSHLIRTRLLSNIPNIRNLAICCDSLVDSAVDLSHLHKLETLKCSSDLSPKGTAFLATLTLPPYIKKLTFESM